MKIVLAMMTAGALSANTALADENGASSKTPGQQMQEQRSMKNSPGASGYAPGQQMRDKRSSPGTTGASGYAPGRLTGGGSTSDARGASGTNKTKQTRVSVISNS